MQKIRFLNSAAQSAATLVVWSLVWALTGCSFSAKNPAVRIVPFPIPPISAEHPLPSLPGNDPKLGLVLSESVTAADPELKKFADAREAYWNGDTDTAVKLFRELQQQSDSMSTNHFHWLVLQCFGESDRWEESLPLYSEFGIEESWRKGLETARFMASLPPRQIEFDADAPRVPFTFKLGHLVIVEAEINGAKARFLVDTGFERSLISEAFAQRAGVEIQQRNFSLIDANNRKQAAGTGLAAELRVGGMTARNLLTIIVKPGRFQKLLNVEGVIGWDVLRHADVTWDFPAKLMTLAPPSGPVSAQPNLSGRSRPIVTVVSDEGRPLHLFLDTGAASRLGFIDVFDNDGVLGTKTAMKQFRWTWRPTFTMAAHSFRVKWPRRARPFGFWMAGYRFEVPGAQLWRGMRPSEQLVYLDGLIGNSPFLTGKLTISATRREVRFQPMLEGDVSNSGRTTATASTRSGSLPKTGLELGNGRVFGVENRSIFPFPIKPMSENSVSTMGF